VRRPAGRTRDSATNIGVTTASTIAIGTSTRKIQRQLSESTRTPPAITPRVPLRRYAARAERRCRNMVPQADADARIRKDFTQGADSGQERCEECPVPGAGGRRDELDQNARDIAELDIDAPAYDERLAELRAERKRLQSLPVRQRPRSCRHTTRDRNLPMTCLRQHKHQDTQEGRSELSERPLSCPLSSRLAEPAKSFDRADPSRDAYRVVARTIDRANRPPCGAGVGRHRDGVACGRGIAAHAGLPRMR
jgi:hypothetical protein